MGAADENPTENVITTDEQNNVPIEGQMVLRVLSGPHTGAEIDLTENPIIIGRDPSCDIVLSDPALNGQHIRLFVKDNQVHLEVLEEALVKVDGVAVSGTSTLQDFQGIIIGSTLLSIGENTVTWPTITGEPKPEQVTENASEPEENSSQELSKEKPASTEQTNESKSLSVSKKEAIKDLFFKYKAYLFAGIGAFVFLCVGIGYVRSMFSEDVENNSQSTEQAAQQAPAPRIKTKKQQQEFALETLNKYNVDEKNFSLEEIEGGLKLIVYVSTQLQRKDLLKALSSSQLKKITIYSQENLVMQAQEAIKAARTLSVEGAPQLDTVTLQGYLYNIDSLPAIKNRIFNDTPGLKFIQTTLLNAEEVREMASNLLTQYGLMGLLTVHTIESGLVITGSIPSQKEPAWKEAQKALKSTFNNICRVFTRTSVLPQEQIKSTFFQSNIASVSIPENETPWIDLKNGERYFEGTTLPSNFVLQSITPEGITLNKNEDTIHFSLEEL